MNQNVINQLHKQLDKHNRVSIPSRKSDDLARAEVGLFLATVFQKIRSRMEGVETLKELEKKMFSGN